MYTSDFKNLIKPTNVNMSVTRGVPFFGPCILGAFSFKVSKKLKRPIYIYVYAVYKVNKCI
jgi:hypothetical protein